MVFLWIIIDVIKVLNWPRFGNSISFNEVGYLSLSFYLIKSVISCRDVTRLISFFPSHPPIPSHLGLKNVVAAGHRRIPPFPTRIFKARHLERTRRFTTTHHEIRPERIWYP